MMYQPITPPSAGWCILRTSPGRTLQLAKSLAEAGLDAWTPHQMVRRRIPRSKNRREVDAPIMPTFVFVRAEQLPDLTRILALPIMPHPTFSIFRYCGDIPIVADREIAGLRQAEDKARRVEQKKQRYAFDLGAAVRVTEGPATGMSGVVEAGDGKFALVAFGGTVRLKIATFLLSAEYVKSAAALTGIAA